METHIFKEKETEELSRLYAESDLELGKNWAETAVFSFACREGEELLGAATVSFRFDCYILDFIAVAPAKRKSGVGRALAECCVEECRSLGAEELWLQARTPAFFRKIGAVETGGKMLLSECLTCPDYNKVCSPVEMKFSWRTTE